MNSATSSTSDQVMKQTKHLELTAATAEAFRNILPDILKIISAAESLFLSNGFSLPPVSF
jgi:hypothetical protein